MYIYIIFSHNEICSYDVSLVDFGIFTVGKLALRDFATGGVDLATWFLCKKIGQTLMKVMRRRNKIILTSEHYTSFL